MDENLKAAEGELSEKDLAALGIPNAKLTEVIGGAEDGTSANPESPDGSLENPDSQGFVWLNTKQAVFVFLLIIPEENLSGEQGNK